MRVIIMRGVPGSGKSTYIKNHFPEATVCSADTYFINPKTGVYEFNASKLGEAHKACMRAFLMCTEDDTYGSPLVVVDNTNIQLWEFAGYLQVARARDYDVEIIRLVVDPEVAAARCVHGVPAGHIKRMAERMNTAPKDWKETVVS